MNKRQQIKALKKEIVRLKRAHRVYKLAAFGALYGMKPAMPDHNAGQFFDRVQAPDYEAIERMVMATLGQGTT